MEKRGVSIWETFAREDFLYAVCCWISFLQLSNATKCDRASNNLWFALFIIYRFASISDWCNVIIQRSSLTTSWNFILALDEKTPFRFFVVVSTTKDWKHRWSVIKPTNNQTTKKKFEVQWWDDEIRVRKVVARTYTWTKEQSLGP